MLFMHFFVCLIIQLACHLLANENGFTPSLTCFNNTANWPTDPMSVNDFQKYFFSIRLFMSGFILVEVTFSLSEL